ncbi:MAG: hypothetical protein ABIA47_00420 [bacterium]
MDKNKIFDVIKALELPIKDFAIVSSGPMIVRNLIPCNHDIDILARGKAWEMVTKLGEVTQAAMRDHMVKLENGTIEIFDGWAPSDRSDDELIDSAEMIDGLPFVKLEYVLEYKKKLGRVKDLKHVEILEAYLDKQKKA